jgi:hypothetical protein
MEGKPFALLSVAVGEERPDVRNFMTKTSYTFPVLLDSDLLVSMEYHVRQHPMKFLIDAKGRMVGYAIGYGRWDAPEMKTLIRKLM